nr:hypothetical protein [Microbacterium bovistercoris]
MSSAPSSDSDILAAALQTAASDILRGISVSDASAPVVLIDGRSGAGKSSLARLLVAQWPTSAHAQLVALDWLYPGWDGLEGGVDRARDDILLPHRRGQLGVWRRWDWEAGVPAEEHIVDPALPLIVEGSGMLTAATAPLSEVRVWLEAPDRSRKDRALRRDGDLYRPHWERWAAQEQRHLARDRPMDHATHTVVLP